MKLLKKKNWNPKKKMIKVVFLGTPQIAVNTLEKLLSVDDIEVLAVGV